MKMSIENLEFPLCLKKKITMIKGIGKLKLEFIGGKLIKFENTNLGLEEPHKIVISNSHQYVVLVTYENDSNLYMEDLSNQITFTQLYKIVERLLHCIS